MNYMRPPHNANPMCLVLGIVLRNGTVLQFMVCVLLSIFRGAI